MVVLVNAWGEMTLPVKTLKKISEEALKSFYILRNGLFLQQEIKEHDNMGRYPHNDRLSSGIPFRSYLTG